MALAVRHLVDPGTLAVATANAVGATHTHAITSSANPGAAASLLASDANGYLRLTRLGVGAAPSYPLHVAGQSFLNDIVGIGNDLAGPYAGIVLYLSNDSRGQGVTSARGINVVTSTDAASTFGYVALTRAYYTGANAATLIGMSFTPNWYGTAPTISVRGVTGSVYLRSGSSKVQEAHCFSAGFYVESVMSGGATLATVFAAGIGNNINKQFDEYALFYAPVQGAVATTQWSIRILSVYPSTLAGRLSVGHSDTPTATLHVRQNGATANIPVLTLKQADVDVVLAQVVATAQAASADRTLAAASDFGTPGALVGWIQVAIQDDGDRIADGDYYIPFYAVPTA